MGAVNSILQTVHQFGFGNADADSDLREGLEVAMERNTNLTSFMKNFARVIRIAAPNLQEVDLNSFMENSAKIWSGICKEKNIILETDFTSVPSMTLIDPIQMEQVISNMIKNSIESIGENGHIMIGVFEDRNGFYVNDNGAGIDETNKNNLFSPFFSTKPYGQGVGLMLINEILQNHGFKFTLITEGEWTSFKVWN